MVGLLAVSEPAMAMDGMKDHGGGTFHAVRLETGIGSKDAVSWDIDGWAGGDTHKIWLKSEGEVTGGKTEKAELWGLYSRNVSTFWDRQVGVRYDLKSARPGSRAHSYLVGGVHGLAPYFFDTEAHVFVRDDGAVSGRVRVENAWLITNRLIVRPRVEIDLNTRDDPREGIGVGLSEASLGLQTRYEITRGFAPYAEVTWRKRFGKTADYARRNGEKSVEGRVEGGISWLF